MTLWLPPAPEILTIKPLTSAKATQYRMSEYAVGLRADTGPFDPADIALDLQVRTPSGKHLPFPAFLSALSPHRSSGNPAVPRFSSTDALAAGKASPTRTVDDAEVMVAAGPPEWRVRFAPRETGVHRLEFVLHTRQA